VWPPNHALGVEAPTRPDLGPGPALSGIPTRQTVPKLGGGFASRAMERGGARTCAWNSTFPAPSRGPAAGHDSPRSLTRAVVARVGSRRPESCGRQGETEGLLLLIRPPWDNNWHECKPTPLLPALMRCLPTIHPENLPFECDPRQLHLAWAHRSDRHSLGFFHHSELDFFSTFFQLCWAKKI